MPREENGFWFGLAYYRMLYHGNLKSSQNLDINFFFKPSKSINGKQKIKDSVPTIGFVYVLCSQGYAHTSGNFLELSQMVFFISFIVYEPICFIFYQSIRILLAMCVCHMIFRKHCQRFAKLLCNLGPAISP